MDTPAPSEFEIAELARQHFLDSNREKGHDLQNWKCAEKTLKQKQHAQEELEKVALQGHF
jgi:hypothetical protein